MRVFGVVPGGSSITIRLPGNEAAWERFGSPDNYSSPAANGLFEYTVNALGA